MSRTLDRSQGKFEAMPVSDGAPIVESGSNADGEWTRWADGTQTCGYVDGAAPVVAPAEGRNWTYPAAYNIPPYVIGCALWSNADLRAFKLTSAPLSSSSNYMIVSVDPANLDSGLPSGSLGSMVATGRWK